MPWDDLTEAQQTFLRRYLQSSTWDFIFGAETSDVNKPVIAGFEAFESNEREYRNQIGQIPDDYPERRAIENAADEAKGLRDQGKFSDANKIMAGAVADIGTTVSILTRAAEALRFKAKPVIAGVNVSETEEIEQLHRDMMDMLADDLPSRAEMTAARDKGGELDRAAERIGTNVARRQKAREDFDEAFKRIGPELERVAAEKPDAWIRQLTSSDDIDAAIDEAARLSEEVKEAEGSEDEARHVSVTEKLNEWNKTSDTLDNLIEASRLEAEQVLRDAYADFEADLDENSNLNLAAYPQDDEQRLTPLMAQLAKDRQEILDTLSGGDPAEQLRRSEDVDEVKNRLREFQRQREIARDNRQKEQLAAAGVSKEQATRIAKMRQVSPGLVASVSNVVEQSNKVIGDVEVTTKLIDEHQKRQDSHLKDWQEAGSKIDSLDKLIEKNKADQKAVEDKLELSLPGGMQESEAALERLDELEGDTTTEAENERQVLNQRLKEIFEQFDKQDFLEITRLSELRTDLEDQMKDAVKEQTEAGDKWNAEGAFIKAAKTKKRMLDAVTFGPLSPDRSNALGPDDVKKLVDLYQQDLEVAEHAVATIAKAKHPESVMSAVNTLSGRLASNLGNDKWTKDDAQDYANQIITMAGSLPSDLVDMLEDYLNNDSQLKSVPEMGKGKTFEELSKSRTSYVTKMLVNSDGSLDYDSAVNGLCDVVFHPDSVLNGTPVVASHIYDTIEYFRNSPTAEDKIKAITLPTDPGALQLLSKGSGQPKGAITQETARQEVVNAMLTPVYQGEVGSCFATAGVLRLRQTDPDRALELYSDLVTKGTFTPKHPDPTVVPVPVPVILNVPSKDNPLIRSLEFTVGTAAAIDQDSELNLISSYRSALAVKKVKDKIKPSEWNKVKAKLKRAIPGAFTFSYNADVDIVDSSDGSSKKGGYELISKADYKGIKSEDDYVKAVTPIVLAQIEALDMEAGVTEATVRDLVKSRDFLDQLKVDGKMPWELSSGGSSIEATKVLEGKSVSRDDFIPEIVPSDDLDLRTRKIVESLLTAFDGVTDDLAPIETGGMHTFNALPQHPSLAKLTQGGSGSISTNFATEVLDKGTALKDADIPVEKAALMVERQLQSLAKNASDLAKEALENAILVHRPTTPLKPAALKALMKTACADYVNAVAKAKADAWKEMEKDKSGVEPDTVAYDKKVAEWKKNADGWVENASLNILVSDLDAPQFVIADSNWGDPRTRTMFVLCPDPETGQPKMFERADPGGKLRPMGEDWLKTNWLRVK